MTLTGEEIFGENPLKSKEDIQRFAKGLLDSIEAQIHEGEGFLKVDYTSSRYPNRTAWIEGFLRPLFALAPLSAGGYEYSWNKFLKGIISGTNKESLSYWGGLKDKDQKIVEMASISFAILISPEKIWLPLSDSEKYKLSSWLRQVNEIEIARNNWIFFWVLVNIALKSVNEEYSEVVLENALKKIENSYLGDGWYSDGPGDQRDYYVAFAMHLYGLIYAKHMEKDDPKRSKIYKTRAFKFAKDFIYYFSSEGDSLPYGRSLTYKFAAVAFWSGLVYAGVYPFEPGIIKGIILRNLRWWYKQPIYDGKGILSIGYRYPNLKMAEFYNAPGSQTWAFKAFLILALSDNDRFWTCDEEEFPELDSEKIFKHGYMLMRRENSTHIQAYTSGQYARFEPSFASAKYEKFVYSNKFGFSIPGSDYGYWQGAYDSMLALCEDGDGYYRVRRKCERICIKEKYIYSLWKPWKDVKIESYIVPFDSWHVRVHVIDSKRDLLSYDSSYAINCQDMDAKDIIKEDSAFLTNVYGTTGIVDPDKTSEAGTVLVHPNTNILYSRSKIAYLKRHINKGKSIISSIVIGTTDRFKDIENPPEISFEEKDFKVNYKGNEIVICYHLNEFI